MNLTAEHMRAALTALEKKLPQPVRLVMGGGGAMLLAHELPLSTADIDAVPSSGSTVQELDPFVKQVASELGIPSDWLNPYYSTFMHVLPADYGARLVSVLSLPKLEVLALSKEDLLIMKCFAGRQKDVSHARGLLKRGADARLVESHLERLVERNIPGAVQAMDFWEELL